MGKLVCKVSNMEKIIYMMDGKIPVELSIDDLDYADIILADLPSGLTGFALQIAAMREMKRLGYTNEKAVCSVNAALERKC